MELELDFHAKNTNNVQRLVSTLVSEFICCTKCNQMQHDLTYTEKLEPTSRSVIASYILTPRLNTRCIHYAFSHYKSAHTIFISS